jgi:branched-chain amino acid transport system substrate-binding protein
MKMPPVSTLACACVSALFLINGCKPNATENQITIGAVLPLTGDAAQWGVAAQRGIQIAVDETNAAGGVRGSKVQILFEDDQLQPKVGTEAMQKLVNVNKVPAVIGSISSSVTLAIAPIAERNKVVLISPASTSHDITTAGDFIFRTIPTDVYEGGYMAKFAFNERKYRTVAVLAVNAAGTQGMADSFRQTFLGLGGENTVYELVPQGGTDFRASVSKAIAIRPNAIYVVGFPLETGHMIKQLVELGFTGQILSAQPAEDPEVRKIAGSAAEGLVLTTTSIDPETGSLATKSFVSEYRRRYKSDPPVFSYEAYDAARLVLSAIAERGLDGLSIRDFLYGVKEYDGASGKFGFDQNGDVNKAIRIVTIQSGKIQALTQ